MWKSAEYPSERAQFGTLLLTQLAALTDGERDPIANLSNASALLKEAFTDVNWAGFYLYRQNQLILGPFQGLPACIRIPLGKGVCGTAAAQKKTVLVRDVHSFPGHIACDGASRSEIVVPLLQEQRLLGVLDMDSPSLSRFTEEDAALLEQFAACLVTACDWPGEENA